MGEAMHIMPLWLEVIVTGLLLSLSGLFSGINLGLMALEQDELREMIRSGTGMEKQYAKAILPLRKRENFLLCAIIFGNVLVNSTLAMLMDDLTGSGVAAVVCTTLGIAIFGEIIPQAICSRYGLAVGAKTAWFTRFCMLITFPLAYPISQVLDCVLGKELGYVCDRAQLHKILRFKEEWNLVKEKVSIIKSALELSNKNVGHIMIKLKDIFMIPSDAILDSDTLSMIRCSRCTRIPIFESEPSNIIALLNIKDVGCLDGSERTPLQMVIKCFEHPVKYVCDDTKLDAMLEIYKKEHCRMAIVTADDGRGGRKNVGLVTLQDLIEETVEQVDNNGESANGSRQLS